MILYLFYINIKSLIPLDIENGVINVSKKYQSYNDDNITAFTTIKNHIIIGFNDGHLDIYNNLDNNWDNKKNISSYKELNYPCSSICSNNLSHVYVSYCLPCEEDDDEKDDTHQYANIEPARILMIAINTLTNEYKNLGDILNDNDNLRGELPSWSIS